jgi:putative membrane protein
VTAVVWIFALAGAAVHLLAFAWEVLLFERPGVHQGIFAIPTGDLGPVRLWSFNVGFYNLFLAAGAIAGVALWAGGDETVGRALIIYTSLFMFLAGIALFASDRMELSRPRGAGVAGSLAQSGPPLVTLIAVML